MHLDIYGIGNAIMDLQVRCEDAFLHANGIDKGLMTLTEPARQREILDVLADHSVHHCSGGSAANTIVGIADLGGRCAYAGKTGEDAFGRRYLEEMRALGIAIECSPTAGDTGTCVVLITPDAQRTMLTHLGVSSTLAPEDVHEAHVAAAKYVYIEGYLLAGDSTREAALHAASLAKRHGARVALTVSDPFIVEAAGETLRELIEGPVDLLFCNHIEAAALTGMDDAIEAARELHRMCPNVALTLGRNGSIIMHEGEVIAIEGIEVEAVDTTGAGDMYAAGVLYGITHDLGWKKAGHLGSHAAAQIVAQLGARLPRRYTRAEIEALLA
ncbi:MAG: adenosine kinase [Mariprofundaceae bacterium]